MRELVLEELLEKVKNRFLLVVSAARRARQIKDGAKVLIDAPEGEPPVIIALDEILEDKIRIEIDEIKGATVKEYLPQNKKAAAKVEDPQEDPKIKKTIKKDAKKESTKKRKSRSMAA